MVVKAPTQLVVAVDEALVALVDVGPRLAGVAAHLRQMGENERADLLDVSSREISKGVQQVNYYLTARGGDLRDIASAVIGLRDSFQAKFFPFAQIARHLRAEGLDAHAGVLEHFVCEMLCMTHTIQTHAQDHGLLDDTLSMSLADVSRIK